MGQTGRKVHWAAREADRLVGIPRRSTRCLLPRGIISSVRCWRAL